jgi:hypothetical protein
MLGVEAANDVIGGRREADREEARSLPTSS